MQGPGLTILPLKAQKCIVRVGKLLEGLEVGRLELFMTAYFV